ncbi:electron transport complex subunit RsxG [Shewanella cyperi]|uniref:Ion-translocating oxidoreductase complex subunit G n=1 Tax=Shewanella cyperi TaxID=2814292 RepID=A0A974XQP1_9GAMM|nr:electron transport complex subunit RsxG [Shewanella cyperi]QSX31628.1 electron transport complex subunit RsxG [Shewanella cyperi]
MSRTMLKNGLLLALFALICTALVAVVNSQTKDKIRAQEQLQLQKILHQIVPDEIHDNELSEHCTLVHDPAVFGTDDALPAYLATRDGKPVALAIETQAPDGYNGAIRLIIGVDMQGKVLGIRTLSHQETPGLGDKIELTKSPWVLAFTGKPYSQEEDENWQVKKDGGEFDQFTGATITPRAYLKATRTTLAWLETNRESLFRQALHCDEEKGHE